MISHTSLCVRSCERLPLLVLFNGTNSDKYNILTVMGKSKIKTNVKGDTVYYGRISERISKSLSNL